MNNKHSWRTSSQSFTCCMNRIRLQLHGLCFEIYKKHLTKTIWTRSGRLKREMFWRTLLHLHFQVQGRCVSLHRTLLPPASDDFRPWLNESVFSFTVFCNIFRNAFLSIFIFPFSLPLASVTWIRPDTRIPAGPTHSGKLQGKERRLLNNNNNNNNNNTHIGPIMQKPLMQFEVWIFAKCRRPDCSKLRERNVEQHEMFFNFSPRFQSWKPTRPQPGVRTRSRHAVSGRPSTGPWTRVPDESWLLWSKESDVLRWAVNVSVCVSAEGQSSLSSLFRIQTKTPRQGTRRWNWNQRTTPRISGSQEVNRRTEDTCEGTEDTCEGTEDTCEGTGDTCEGTGDTCEGTEDTCEGTEDTCEGTEDTREGTEDTCEGTEDTCEGTEDTCEGTEDTCEGTEDTCEGTRDTCEGTEDTCEGTEDTCEGTEDTCEGTEDTCEGTEDTCEGTEDTCEGTGDTCEGTEDTR